jgi:hypothetical protein
MQPMDDHYDADGEDEPITPLLYPTHSPQIPRVSRFVETGLINEPIDPPCARIIYPGITRLTAHYPQSHIDHLERQRRIADLERLKYEKVSPDPITLRDLHDFYISDLTLDGSHDFFDPDDTMAGIFGSAAPAAASSATATQGSIANDVTLNGAHTDSIQDLSFSPVSGHLSVASWDNKVYIYEVNEDGSNQGKTMMDLKAPALSTCWSKVCYIPSRRLRIQAATNTRTGRQTSLRRRRKQSSNDARPWKRRHHSSDSRCPRRTHQMHRKHLGRWSKHDCHWFLGQDYQILGLPPTDSRRFRSVQGTCLRYGYTRPTSCRRYCRSLGRDLQPQPARSCIQADPESSQVADQDHQLLRRRHRFRHWFHRRKMCYSIRRGKGLEVSLPNAFLCKPTTNHIPMTQLQLLIQMPPPKRP